MSVYGLTSSRMMPLDSSVLVSEVSVVEERRMRVPQETMKVIVRHLRKFELNLFAVENRKLVDWQWVPLLASYCCNISESRSC